MIEILYFDGCPNHAPTVELAKQVVAELGVEVEIREVRIDTPEDVREKRFLGSPTVRVNGQDIEPGVRESQDFSLGCRLYGTGGVPPKQLLVDAIRGVG